MNFFKSTTLILVVSLMTLSVYSQQFEFKLLATKGTIELKNKSTNWRKIKTGDNININDIIRVGDKSYAGLLHKSGKTIELKDANQYVIKDLSEKLSNHKSSFSKRFAKYVSEEIADNESVVNDKNYKTDMQSTGSVDRGVADRLNKINIQINTPRKFTTLQQNIKLYWNKTNDVSNYKFTLTDRFDRQIFTTNTTDTTITINLEKIIDLQKKSKEKLKDVYYFWKVSSPTSNDIVSETACFMILSPNTIKATNDSLNQLRKELEDDSSSLNQLIYASFFENNQLIFEACDAYKKAISLSPDIPEFKQLYDNFLKKYKFSGF